MIPGQPLTILSLEDSVPDFELIREQLLSAGYTLNITRVEKETDFVTAISTTKFDTLLADFKLPGFDAFSALKLSNEICPEVPFICVSGMIGEETAAEIIKQGAVDYVLKDKLGRLPSALERALNEAKEKESRRQAEDALRESEQNFRTLADSGQTLIWAAGTDKRCNYFNRVWLEFTGHTLEQELGNSCINDIHPDDAQQRIDIYHKAFDLRDKFSAEYRLLHHSGEYLWIQENGSPRYSSTGEFLGYIGQCQDITRRKQSELELQKKNEELQKLNAEKDKFFSIIAHDLRSPFSAFLGYTQMMEEELETFTVEELQNIASTMRKSANMLFNLLENLLEWSRMQRGLNSFKPELFLLREQIEAGIELVRDATEKKKIGIYMDIPGDLLVFADPQMFESLIRNLVFNAIKFTPQGGEIKIDAKTIPGNSVQVSVKDTGIGMNNDILDKLFRMNEDTNRKGTEGEPSTGLGLIICKDFIDKLGGEIWAESEEGEGSTFYFTLPGSNEQEGKNDIRNTIAPHKTYTKIKPLKILIAEDDDTSEMLISITLKKFSKVFLKAATGSEAVEICRTNPDIDLVMMDIQMPEMDGYEATRHIRQFNSNVVIIAQTAFGKLNESETAKEAGCNEYITKPLNLDMLRKLMLKHF
ncbi:MAG: response regulator [Bacteroidales bacterium]|nr:response regulator [Bacteroidales bacterium]